MKSSIFGTLIVGMALLMVGCNSPARKEAIRNCHALGATYADWDHSCVVDGYSQYPWRDQWEQEKLKCVAAGGVPYRADRDREYWAGCPNDESVQCVYKIPRVTCGAKSNSVNINNY